MPTNQHTVHIDLDGAWPRDAADGAAYFDAREWGPRLRFSAPPDVIESFYAHAQPQLAAFTLFGSGDFHHLAALWMRRIREPFTLVSFDNHPDWDVRPPRWGCGGWINRALELPTLRRAVVWGCGNFEFDWPHRMFANQAAQREGRLKVWPWEERLRPKARERWPGMTRENWREKFDAFAAALAGECIYVTIDLDCLRAGESVTNWEQGLFSAEDIAHALRTLRAHAGELAGGDVCGAWSRPEYARWKQKFAATFDHPRLPEPDENEARERNMRAQAVIWPALTGEP
jgi:arginase family enzyme